MRKVALVTLLAGLFLSASAYSRPRRFGAHFYVGPVHAGFYAYGVYAPRVPVFYYAPPVAYYLPPPPVFYVAPPPPPTYVAEAPVYTPPAPPVYYAPPEVPPPPTLVVAPPPVEVDRIPRLALKWAPVGVTSAPQAAPGGSNNVNPFDVGNIGLEYRFPNRYWALRSDFEYGPNLGVWDFISLKLSLFPHSFIRPYISGGITGSNVYDHNLSNGVITKTPAAGGVAAAGVDVFFGKHFFIEAEGKGRLFAFPVGGSSVEGNPQGAPGPVAQGFQPVAQWTATIGAGVALF
jgi:hypothetical protein